MFTSKKINSTTTLYTPEEFSDNDEESKAISELTDVERPDFKLMPEFGNWMIEAVPSDPYDTYQDPGQLLKCKEKIANR